MKREFLLLFIFCYILSGNICFSWDANSHQAIAKLAELNIKSETLAKVNKILNGETMVSVATWADGEIRQTQKETDHWHGVSISIKNDISEKNIKTFYPKSKDNVIFQLKRIIKELKEPATTEEEKYKDLKFLIHFTGDLHMPMHCASNGGKNIIDTEANKAKEKPQTLHNVWDGMIKIKDVNEYAEQLNKNITAERRKLWAKNDPDEWVYESFKISKDVIFKDIPFEAKYITLPKDYKKEMEPIAKERIEKAGIRLAMLLDYIFK
jgi:hypothetical protein